MKTLKRAVAILLMITLLAALLCACGGKNEGAAERPKPGNQSNGSADEATQAAQLEKLPDFDPLDWSAVEDAPAEDFTYEILNAYDPTVDDWADVIKLLSYSGDDNIVKIPDRIDGYCVRFAAQGMFKGNTTITHVYLPTYMSLNESDELFRDCIALLQVQMPVDWISVPTSMFNNCTALREVTFTTTKDSGFYPTWVYSHAFSGCSSLTSLALPEYITEIENGAFSDCVRLEEIKLPSVEHIGEYAFSDCISLKEVSLDSVRSIGYNTFDGCTNLKSVAAPKLNILRGEAFQDCVSLTDLTLCEIYEGLSSDRMGSAFNGCTSLKTISLAPGEKESDRYLVFEDGILYLVTEGNGTTSSELIRVLEAYRDKEIVLREDVHTIGAYAFHNMAFQTFEVPASVRRVETRAFNNCPNLKKITEEAGSDYIYWNDDAFDECPMLRIIDLSARPWEYMNRGESDFYGYDCPVVEKVVFPGEDQSP